MHISTLWHIKKQTSKYTGVKFIIVVFPAQNTKEDFLKSNHSNRTNNKQITKRRMNKKVKKVEVNVVRSIVKWATRMKTSANMTMYTE